MYRVIILPEKKKVVKTDELNLWIGRLTSAPWWFDLNSDTWVEFIELRSGSRFLLLRTQFPLQNRVSTWALELTSKPGHYVWGDSSRWNCRAKYERWVDVESLSVFKMSEPLNCCVSGCLNYNNFRNSSGLHYYRIPKGSRPLDMPKNERNTSRMLWWYAGGC